MSLTLSISRPAIAGYYSGSAIFRTPIQRPLIARWVKFRVKLLYADRRLSLPAFQGLASRKNKFPAVGVTVTKLVPNPLVME